jgi:hypothetical protein
MYNITNPAELNRQAVLPFSDILPAIARDANLKIGVSLSEFCHTGKVPFLKRRRGFLPAIVGIKLLERDL